jgi:hypothetical protein
MKKYAVLSVNANEDYLFFVPLVCWAWRKFGWEPLLFIHGDWTYPMRLVEKMEQNLIVRFVNGVVGYRSDTITQISRLYAAVGNPDDDEYFMTADIDMIPLSDYWKPDKHQVTVYGHDLTGYGHYPICYIGMPKSTWQSVMCLNVNMNQNRLIQRDLDSLPQAKDPDFYKYWFSDQDLITQRLNEYGKEKITFINRGQGSHGYARGRVDRGSGGWVLDQPELIDAHLIQQAHHKQERVQKILDLLVKVWPNEDWTWWLKYTEEFRKLTGHTA